MVVGSNEQRLEVEGKISNGKYQFKIRACPKDGKPFLRRGRLPEEFIEDNIDNSKNIDCLEDITLEVAKDHLEELLSLRSYTIARRMRNWFEEARRQLDQEKDGNKNKNSK